MCPRLLETNNSMLPTQQKGRCRITSIPDQQIVLLVKQQKYIEQLVTPAAPPVNKPLNRKRSVRRSAKKPEVNPAQMSK